MKKYYVLLTILLIGNLLFAQPQKGDRDIIADFEKAVEAILSGDSTLYFSTAPADYTQIDGFEGKVQDVDDTWQIAKSIAGAKMIARISSIKTQGDVAWMIFNWSLTGNEEGMYDKSVNFIDKDPESFNHVASTVLVKRKGTWEIVLWHYTNIPHE